MADRKPYAPAPGRALGLAGRGQPLLRPMSHASPLRRLHASSPCWLTRACTRTASPPAPGVLLTTARAVTDAAAQAAYGGAPAHHAYRHAAASGLVLGYDLPAGNCLESVRSHVPDLELYSRKIVSWEVHDSDRFDHAAYLVRRTALA